MRLAHSLIAFVALAALQNTNGEWEYQQGFGDDAENTLKSAIQSTIPDVCYSREISLCTDLGSQGFEYLFSFIGCSLPSPTGFCELGTCQPRSYYLFEFYQNTSLNPPITLQHFKEVDSEDKLKESCNAQANSFKGYVIVLDVFVTFGKLNAKCHVKVRLTLLSIL